MSKNKKDFNEILNVPVDASSNDFRKSDKKLVFDNHPDKNESSDGNNDIFKRINNIISGNTKSI